MYDDKQRAASKPPKPRPPKGMKGVPADTANTRLRRDARKQLRDADNCVRDPNRHSILPSALHFSHLEQSSGHDHAVHLECEHDLPVAHETSAGGVIVKVENGQAYVAVIARRNRAGHIEWCLPKGHLEGAETAVQAAVREVSEETGIFGRALKHLSTIDYWFSGRHHRIHKVVHHYLLEALSGTITVENDPDHEAEKAEWVHIAQVSSRLAYPNERKIVAIASAVLRGQA